ncbi:helix-turn-helix domain-containing protein [Tepidimonas sp.]|uniref:helix-turn-helix domain-containing protein n=1 Tax=Tepidimonas sp. TaxID=2002775 RepID=UPI002FE1859A
MSETVVTPPAAVPQSAGEALRQARERAGLHIAAVAATLKVPVQRLEALEAGRYEALPDATFVRALALSVCRVLKIDAAPILAALPAGQAPQLGLAYGSIDAPMPRESASPDFGSSEGGGWRTPLWIALALVVLAGVLWFVLPTAGRSPEVPVAGGAERGAGPSAATVPSTADASPGATGSAPMSPPPAAAAAPASPTAPAVPVVPAAAPQASASASAAGGAEPAAPAAPAALQLRVQAASWIQVIGASGRVWLQRSLQPGEDVRFDEDLPLAVTVGRADATEVVVRGQPFDLGPMTRNNVARFEIR